LLAGVFLPDRILHMLRAPPVLSSLTSVLEILAVEKAAVEAGGIRGEDVAFGLLLCYLSLGQ